MTKLNANETLKAAGYETVADSANYLAKELEGAVLTLQSVNINVKTLGMSDVNTLVMSRGIREAKLQESRTEKIKTARIFKTGLVNSMKKFVNGIKDKQGLATEAAGISPSGTIGTYSVGVAGSKKIACTIKAIRLFPDDEKLKELKTSKIMMTEKIGKELDDSKLLKIRELLELEAGTKENKTISLFKTDPESKETIQDKEFKYQISLSIFDSEKPDCEPKKTETEMPATILRPAKK